MSPCFNACATWLKKHRGYFERVGFLGGQLAAELEHRQASIYDVFHNNYRSEERRVGKEC